MSTLPPEYQQLLISGYVLGNLSSDEALLFKVMLEEDPALIEQVNAMQDAWDNVYTLSEVWPPPALRDRILASVNAEKAGLEAVKLSARNQKLNNSFKPKISITRILGVISVATITMLGIVNYRLFQTVKTAKTTKNKNIPVNYLLRSQDASNSSTAKLVVYPERLRATFTANNLPSLPAEKAYALWTVVGKDIPYTTDEKGAILTAVFQVNESGDFTQEIAVPQPHLESKTVKKIAITVEDIIAPQVHKGSVFISSGN